MTAIKKNGMRLYRVQACLSQEEVAKMAGIGTSTVCLAEAGYLSLKTLERIAKAYGKSAEDFAKEVSVPLFWVGESSFPSRREAELFSRRTGIPVTEVKG